MTTTQLKTQVTAYDKVRTYYVKKKILGSLISWYEKIQTDQLGTTVVVFVPKGTKVIVEEK